MATTPVLSCIDVTALHRPIGRRWMGAALATLVFMSNASAGVMGDSRCRNLQAILTHGPDYHQLKGEAKSLGDGMYKYALQTSPAPFEQCELLTYPFVDPTLLECRISIPLEVKGVMTRDNHNQLKEVLSGVAKEIGTCIGATLPPVKASKPHYGQPAGIERFEWAFTTAYHGPSSDRAVGVWLWMLLPREGTDLNTASKIELEAQFQIIPKNEVGTWGRKSG
ncbi:hypothetical protein M2D63_024965 [Pseudomonas sp. BJa5]|uniref:hypothetical protein n=1 Tax=Pseudomonas sp. BJa5 TaxID=2936270 RepID=UPI002559C3D4|nr:hypothetical protein [Pseudomonas sp. BGr12]MDL2424369.1 hypothetical protein [Pseudomonas sp. BGr12]